MMRRLRCVGRRQREEQAMLNLPANALGSKVYPRERIFVLVLQIYYRIMPEIRATSFVLLVNTNTTSFLRLEFPD